MYCLFVNTVIFYFHFQTIFCLVILKSAIIFTAHVQNIQKIKFNMIKFGNESANDCQILRPDKVTLKDKV